MRANGRDETELSVERSKSWEVTIQGIILDAKISDLPTYPNTPNHAPSSVDKPQ